MRYGPMFAPKVRSFDVEDEDGETVTFFYLRPRADELLDQRDKDEKSKVKLSQRDQNKRAMKQWLCHEDGTPVEDDEIAAIMAMDSGVFQQFSAKLVEVMSPAKKVNADGEQGNV